MSSIARPQCWLLLPTRTIAPLGTCQTVPSAARSRVVRSDTASTVPLTWGSRSTTSPTPNWSSARMNSPFRKSLTSDCEPNAMATPTTPAPAISGATSTPTSERTMNAASSRIANPATLRRMLVSASRRWSPRMIDSGVSTSVPGARRRTAVIRSRTTFERTPRRARSIRRPTKRLTSSAPRPMRTIVSGVPKIASPIFASAVLSVRSRISRQTEAGSRPQASRSSSAETSASTKGTGGDASSRLRRAAARRAPPRAGSSEPIKADK